MNVNARIENCDGIYHLLKIIGIIALFVIFSGCKVDQSEIYGTYIADYPIAKEILVLKNDGSFFQEVTLKTESKVNKASGKWKYDSDEGDIIFDQNYLNLVDGFGKLITDYTKPKRKGIYIMSVKGIYGKIKIGDDPDGVGLPIYKKLR